MTAALPKFEFNPDHAVELFGTKEARWMQMAARNETLWALENGFNRVCIILPTGVGKTIGAGLILASDQLRDILGKPRDHKIRVLFISHRQRLLTQAVQAYSVEENIEIIPFSMMGTLPIGIVFDIVVVDECHHEATMSFQHQLETVTEVPIIGLTATEDRMDGRLCKFDYFVEPISRSAAVAQGFLAESDVHTFIAPPSAKQVDIVSDMIELCGEKMGQIIIFMKTRAEAIELEQRIIELKYTCRLLVDISEAQLDAALADFETRQFQFAISCMKIGEGVDVKVCDGIIRGRNLGSIPLYNQIIGRAARIGSDCLIFEAINPLAANNISAVDIVGVPRSHTMYYKVRGEWRTHQLV